MAVKCREVGRHLYAFSNRDFGGSGCVIWSHGGGKLFNREFTLLKGISVYFYTPPGHTLTTAIQYSLVSGTDPKKVENRYGFDNSAPEVISLGLATPTDSHANEVKCPDYSLSKAVGYHTGSAEDPHGMTYDDVRRFLKDNRGAMDIITIRHRHMARSKTTLSNAITMIKQSGLGYADIHCSFCRSPSFGKAKGTTMIDFPASGIKLGSRGG